MGEPNSSTEQRADLGDLLRRLRRRADLSQRELAARAGVPQATVARIESGRAVDPRYRTVERLVLAAGGQVRFGPGPVDESRRQPALVPHDELRDQAGRRYPAHLDVWEVREPKDWPGAWWAESYNLPPAVRALTQEPGIRFLLACGFELEASRPAALWLDLAGKTTRPPEAGPLG
ncbi:helix-turn-helix domain-containing protein [Micromonospora sp. SL1-18]|uniref:helix-turn-helix domain-containing protein n=1 Tax=Micromonospora sp. SL1-18 TaxID=3399128 RepID=UPI003A4D79DA